jgi:hypothetical protein
MPDNPLPTSTSTSEVFEQNDPYIIRNLSALLAALEDGQLNVDATTAFRVMMKALQDQGRMTDKPVKGTMTLKIDVHYAEGTTELRCVFDTKVPKLKRHRSLMWPREDGTLSMQPVLPFSGTRLGSVRAVHETTSVQVVRAT